MSNLELYNYFKTFLADKISILDDKPEETIESTLFALWHSAAGQPKSVDRAVKTQLPDLTVQQVDKLKYSINQRIDKVPLSYITGRQGFMGIELLADRRALIPRKETEILGYKALELSLLIAAGNKKVRVIDVCCGAGNLGLALAHYNNQVFVSATDVSKDAIDLTKENIEFLKLNERVKAVQGNLFTAFESEDSYEKIDLIVCNPPYISSAKVQQMAQEIVENEPILAFNGGMLGTNLIIKLIIEAPRFLKKSGWLLFEIGVGQGEFIMKLCQRSNSYSQVDSVSDDLGNIRVILCQK